MTTVSNIAIGAHLAGNAAAKARHGRLLWPPHQGRYGRHSRLRDPAGLAGGGQR